MSALNVLLEMGFSSNRAEKALQMTGNSGPEAAMEWLLAHTDDPSVDEPLIVDNSTNSTSSGVFSASDGAETNSSGDGSKAETDAIARSFQCDDCGKLLKDETEVEFHAAKTNHQNFSESTTEIKPMTEDEKKERLSKLEERIKMRRLEKEAHDKREQIEKEKQRRRTGQEMTEAKKKLEEEELRQIAEQRRKEKMEEKQARQRVLEQIEKDKQARRDKFASSSQSNIDQSSGSTPPKVPAVPVPQQQNSTKKDYDQTKIQIRLPSGQALTQTFGSKEELAAVRLYVQMNQNDIGESFLMMTNFPKRVFTDEDMEKPLYELGLVPSAVIIISKSRS